MLEYSYIVYRGHRHFIIIDCKAAFYETIAPQHQSFIVVLRIKPTMT